MSLTTVTGPSPTPSAVLVTFGWTPAGTFTYTAPDSIVMTAPSAAVNTSLTFTTTTTITTATTIIGTTEPSGPLTLIELRWDFGDGVIAYGNSATHTYKLANPNAQTVLRVTDSKGRYWFSRATMYLS